MPSLNKKRTRWIEEALDKLTVLKLLIVKKIKAKTLKAKTGIFGATERMTLTDNEIDVSSRDLTLKSAGDIILNPSGNDVKIIDTAPGPYNPSLAIESTDTTAYGPILQFKHDSESPAAADRLGTIFFNGDDDGGTSTAYAYIEGILESPTNTDEEGKLAFSVCAGTAVAAVGLTLTGNDGVIDTVISKGATSTTAVAGNITVGGTVDGVDIAARDSVLTSTTTAANAALPKAGGAMTGAITTNSTFDGVDIAVRDALHNFSYHYVVANFYSTSSTTAFFVPLVGGILEEPTPGTNDGEKFGMIAPHDGTLEKVMIRSEQVLRFDFLCELVTASNDTEVPDTVVGTLNGDFSGSILADDNTYTYDWTGTLTSGVNTFSAGQVLAIRIDPTSQYSGDTYCMCVFKYNITT